MWQSGIGSHRRRTARLHYQQHDATEMRLGRTVKFGITFLAALVCYSFSASAQFRSPADIDGATMPGRCKQSDKARCRKEADFRWQNTNRAWCVSGGVNRCKEHVLDGAAMCLDACGDVKAFDRRGALPSPRSGSRPGTSPECGRAAGRVCE